MTAVMSRNFGDCSDCVVKHRALMRSICESVNSRPLGQDANTDIREGNDNEKDYDNSPRVGYECGRVYEISSHTTHRKYVGSTYHTLKYRFDQHMSPTNTCSSKELIRRRDCSCVLLSLITECTKKELLSIEQKWMDRTPSLVNKKKAIRGSKARAKQFPYWLLKR